MDNTADFYSANVGSIPARRTRQCDCDGMVYVIDLKSIAREGLRVQVPPVVPRTKAHMRILTLGDSWTYGFESSDPLTKSWPAQLSKKYNVEVVNLARGGSSNHRALRIGIEELSRDCKYDYVIWPLGPAPRTEILKTGKWHQIWPGHGTGQLDQVYTEFWHPWNDIQYTILQVLQFSSFVKILKIPLYVCGLSFLPNEYHTQFSWINNYKGDNDFNKLNMPLQELNIGVSDLHRKLISLQAMNQMLQTLQPDYNYDVVENYLDANPTRLAYGSNLFSAGGHPNDQGYLALCDFFAKKIYLT